MRLNMGSDQSERGDTSLRGMSLRMKEKASKSCWFSLHGVSSSRATSSRSFVALLIAGLCGLLFVFSTASALAESPWWHVTSSAQPTNLPPGGEGKILIVAANVGDGTAEGGSAPVTVIDRLPPGLTPTAISSAAFIHGFRLVEEQAPKCSLVPVPTCTWGNSVPPYGVLEVIITVKVGAPSGTKWTNEARIEGGEAPSAVSTHQVAVNNAVTPFGVERYEVTPENEGGAIDTQAGAHPFQITSALMLNTKVEPARGFEPLARPAALPKDLSFDLPPGLIGNPAAVPQCPEAVFVTLIADNTNRCPANSALGVALVTVTEPLSSGTFTFPTVLFNLSPGRGEPARFGFVAYFVPVTLDVSVRSGGDYGVTVRANDISQTAGLLDAQVIIWGVPGDARHDQSRGLGCLGFGTECLPVRQTQPESFLTLPTSCAGSLLTTVESDSWGAPGDFVGLPEPTIIDSPTGCERLPFQPSLVVQPETRAANTATGATVDLSVPQEVTLAAEGLAEADVKDTTITLPKGMQVNPAAAGTLEACSEADIGFERYDETTRQTFFHEETEQERLGEAPYQECPEGSKLGTVKITTPLLSEPLEGAVYQAAQDANPFGSLLALYVVAEDKKAGVRVRLAGKVEANPSTGQLVSTFDQTPQLPFEEFDLKFFGGNQAPLATSSCGAYRTETSIEPWSGNPAATPFSEFDVTAGPDGTPCPDPGPFAPSFTAGTIDNQAGAFSPFTLTLTRKDGEQTLGSLDMTLPPGLAGILSSVAQCGEAQANAGTCPPASQIGHVTVRAGVGNEPITLPEAGRPEDPVYLTGPYEGAPFGLAVVVHPGSGAVQPGGRRQAGRRAREDRGQPPYRAGVGLKRRDAPRSYRASRSREDEST